MGDLGTRWGDVAPTRAADVRRGTVRIGISGWRYAPWRGVFYPRGLPQRLELEHASRRLRTIEINGSFYALQRPTSYRSWYEATPPGFDFSVKGGRFITHMLKLRGVEQALPRTTTAAAAIAARHDERLDGRAWTETDADRPLRHVLEVRHPSFRTPELPDLLRRYDVGLVVADTAGTWPCFEDVTSDIVYVRLHGSQELYVSGYDDESLDRWAAKVAAWADTGRDVFVYFDNDVKVRAPQDAQNLADRLGVGSDEAET